MLTEVCDFFGVKFWIEADDRHNICYHFGDKVSWMKFIETPLTLGDFIEINRRLAAIYPEKVIG